MRWQMGVAKINLGDIEKFCEIEKLTLQGLSFQNASS